MDPHEILKVERGASEEKVKWAWRRVAMETHPDRPGGNEARFKVANAAYLKLSSRVIRAPAPISPAASIRQQETPATQKTKFSIGFEFARLNAELGKQNMVHTAHELKNALFPYSVKLPR